MDKTPHAENEKMDQAFAGLDLILRKWLSIWRQTAIHMKEVPAELSVLVTRRKKPLNSNFPKAHENDESSWDGVPKDTMVQVTKQILEGRVLSKEGVSWKSLYWIYDQSIGAPPVPCCGHATEQPRESQSGLIKSLQGHTPAASSPFVDVLPAFSSLVSVYWESPNAAQKNLLWENQGKMKHIIKYTKNCIQLKGDQKYIRKA